MAWAACDVSGSVARQVLINLRPAQMQSQGVGVDEVVRAIQRQHGNLPAGRIEQGPTEQLVRVEGKIKEPAGFNKIIVARRAKGPVYLGPGRRRRGRRAGSRQSLSRINGKPGHLDERAQGAGRQRGGGGQRRARRPPRSSQAAPSDVKLEIVYADVECDRESRSNSVKVTIIEGALLTILIVFLFLHSWRSTVITGLTLPISVIGDLHGA